MVAETLSISGLASLIATIPSNFATSTIVSTSMSVPVLDGTL